MSVKKTPSNCRFRECHYNFISPQTENSQECIGCEGNKPGHGGRLEERREAQVRQGREIT